jgi:phage N-6-adenine-methyltransferase
VARKRNPIWTAGWPGFSSTTDLWATPPHVFAALDREFDFELDVCATAANAKCPRFFNAAQNGLAQEWTGNCWMNPPYGRGIGDWMKKAADSAATGAVVVALAPARTDTNWWQEQVMGRAAEVRLVRGRLRFGDGRGPAPFPSAIVVYHPDADLPVFSGWQPPTAARTVQSGPWNEDGSDDAGSMKSSRRPSLAACPANDESSERRPRS